MAKGVDLISKVIGVLAALLGLAGYVLVIGATILWLRLREAGLTPVLPVSMATKQELIALGAQAVAVWILLVVVLLGMGAWIVTGNPKRRRFGYVEAALALTVTLLTVLALETERSWLLVFPALALIPTALVAVLVWPSWEEVAALLLPSAVGIGLAFALSAMRNINHAATAVAATSVFGVLVLAAPSLQSWRARQDANQAALERLKGNLQDPARESVGDPLVAAALEKRGAGERSPTVAWIGRASVAVLALIAVGVIAVASQVSRGKDFDKALVSLASGDCLEGTYVVSGSDKVVLAEPDLKDKGEAEEARIAEIPSKEILALHVYGHDGEGWPLVNDPKCVTNKKQALVSPAPK